MPNNRPLDKREPEVKQTIARIEAMGLQCTRTTRTGEYRIEYRVGNAAICHYASTSSEALAIAERIRRKRRDGDPD